MTKVTIMAMKDIEAHNDSFMNDADPGEGFLISYALASDVEPKDGEPPMFFLFHRNDGIQDET
jgi:hypothetical protein